MKKSRLEAFSDGVIAIIITIMVLELKVPHETSLTALAKLLPVFLSYLLSFIYVGIYWNNHHHMFATVKKVNGTILWANLHLMFWLSLVPFATAWMGENHFESLTLATYGFVLLMCATAYMVLQAQLIRHNKDLSLLATAVGADWKGKASFLLYILGIGSAYFITWLSVASYVVVAIIWFVPDRRIEKLIDSEIIS